LNTWIDYKLQVNTAQIGKKKFFIKPFAQEAYNFQAFPLSVNVCGKEKIMPTQSSTHQIIIKRENVTNSVYRIPLNDVVQKWFIYYDIELSDAACFN
jgi:hypothetical protein